MKKNVNVYMYKKLKFLYDVYVCKSIYIVIVLFVYVYFVVYVFV